MGAIFLLVMSSTGFQALNSDIDFLKFLMITNSSNCSAFNHGTFAFEVIRGNVEGVASVRSGQLTDIVRARGLYAFDGTNAVFETTYDTQDILRQTTRVGPTEIRTGLTGRRLLSDGTSTCLAITSPQLENSRVDDRVEIFEDKTYAMFSSYVNFIIPVGNGILKNNLTDDIREVISRDGSLKLLNRALDFEGRKTVQIVIGKRNGSERTYVIDVERGALPLEITDSGPNGTVIGKKFFDGLVLIEGSGWLPLKKAVYVVASGRVERTQILDYDVVHKPLPQTFTLTFQRPTSITDRVKNARYMHRTNISLIARPALDAKESVRVKVIRPTDTQTPSNPTLLRMPGERDAGIRWTTIFGFAGLFVLILVIAYRCLRLFR